MERARRNEPNPTGFSPNGGWSRRQSPVKGSELPAVAVCYTTPLFRHRTTVTPLGFCRSHRDDSSSANPVACRSRTSRYAPVKAAARRPELSQRALTSPANQSAPSVALTSADQSGADTCHRGIPFRDILILVRYFDVLARYFKFSS